MEEEGFQDIDTNSGDDVYESLSTVNSTSKKKGKHVLSVSTPLRKVRTPSTRKKKKKNG